MSTGAKSPPRLNLCPQLLDLSSLPSFSHPALIHLPLTVSPLSYKTRGKFTLGTSRLVGISSFSILGGKRQQGGPDAGRGGAEGGLGVLCGMQLSRDINDRQVPQVREIPQRARRCPSEEEGWPSSPCRDCGQTPHPRPKHTSLRGPQCAGAPRWRSWV